MITHTRPSIALRIAQSIVILNVLMLLIGIVLDVRYADLFMDTFDDDLTLIFYILLGSIEYGVLALLILARHPRHTIGWFFMMVSFCFALLFLDVGLLHHALAGFIPSETARGWIILTYWSFFPLGFEISFTLVPLFFPDGHLPSRRWRPVAAVAFFAVGFFFVSLAFTPFDSNMVDLMNARNPLGIPGSEEFFSTLISTSFIFLSVSLLGTFASIVVRYRRSRGVERTQIKWPIYVVAIFIVILPLIPISETIKGRLTFLFVILFPISIGIAILRYRLMDIDLIIRRTLQYALLTGTLALTYFGSVVLTQFIFRSLTGNTDSPLITVISTLAIAALFNPLRYRIQDFIDRRFYRKKYDAEKALAKFAATARDEVDMEKLAGALLEVVEETMQPDHVSLWLAPGKSRQNSL